jgi:hypothetical protein
MSVKIDKLWSDSWFQEQSSITKLLYIYLATNPNLNMVGVFSPNPNVVCIEIGCTIEQLRESTKVLKDRGLIHVKSYNDTIYFIIPAHFSSIPKSESTVARVNKVFNELPEGLTKYLESIGISVNSKVRELKKPTPDEVYQYALTQGYVVSGKDFVKYYEEQSDRYGKNGLWVDSTGKEVRDWKAKLRRIWLRDENKIKTFADAPKGFESFHLVENGVVITPDGWKNNKPWSKNLTTDILLKREYERLQGSS